MLPFDPSELARYGGLTLVARTVVEGFLSGIHRSPFKGFSVEFAEHRQYYPGDELRRVDWRTYGKTDRFFVKEYEEETNLKAFLVVDASGSMRYRGRQAVSKFEYAQRVAASLAYLMLAQLDAVGLVVHDTRVRQLIPPRASSKHLLGLLRGLESVQPGGETALAPVWHGLAVDHLKRRGLVVLISDCFDDPAHLARSLQHLRHRKHEVLLFHVLAPEEIEFPFDRPTRFRDMERIGDEVRVDPRRLRAEYRANFEAYREELCRKAHDLRVDYHLLRTDEPVDRALGAYLARRK
ncbi:MAG: hypothetical protein JWO38_7329 [Gemmataceae bacterium]|nr:hypothetical protein [Gemmataceae bacterium]